MNEKKFTSILHRVLQRQLKRFQVSKWEALIYKVIIEENPDCELEYIPENPKEPKRGNLAFQTDILVKNKNSPLIVIETKYNRLTTHDVLTYSTKALKHKEVYPHLRYGLVIGGANLKTIPKRFFTHNHGFDFAIVIEHVYNKNEVKRFIDTVKEQIKSSEQFLKILKDESDPKVFKSNLEIRG